MKRFVSGIVLLAILGVSVWNENPYYFVAFGVLVIALALWEFYKLAEQVGCECYRFLGFSASAAIVYAFSADKQQMVLPACVALLLAMMIAALFENRTAEDFKRMLGSVAATLLGVFYVVVLTSYLIGVRVTADAPRASRLLTLFFLIIAASDTFAYYTGRFLGKHKLAPRISPGKTVEGSIGGVVGAVFASLVVKYSGIFPELPLSHAVALAVVMNIIGQMGDLFESLLKRGAGAKDAASIIPGHGGLLDRLDSVVFNAPLLYYYFLLSK